MAQNFENDTNVKAYKEIQRQKGNVDAALEAVKSNPKDRFLTDQALAVVYNKYLDPTSVVRESEYARTSEGRALLSRIQGTWDKIKNGGQGYTPAELNSFKSVMDQFDQGAASRFKDSYGKYKDRAIRRGFTPENVVFDYSNPNGSAEQQPKKISQQEYATLPSGTQFIAPDGSVRRKP
jgi:hypothetical protein